MGGKALKAFTPPFYYFLGKPQIPYCMMLPL